MAEASDSSSSADARTGKTALVLAGGGSFGAVQVGTLRALAAHGVRADMVVGSSVGVMNGAYFAGVPTVDGVRRLEAIWRGLRRRDIFPITPRALLGLIRQRDFLLGSHGLYRLVHTHLPFRNLEEARIPCISSPPTCSLASPWCCRKATRQPRTWRARRFPPPSRP
jgi:NTE family protein